MTTRAASTGPKRVACLAIATAVACASDAPDARDAGVSSADAARASADAALPDAAPPLPRTLAETGLYADADAQIIAREVLPYAPQFELWSDGASKRRWVYLPPGEQIDTSDMDFWVFPRGTKLWKEFTRDGARVETRLLYKAGPRSTDWYAIAYAWDAEQREATAVPLGVRDALGTPHDIPSQRDCQKCHDRVPDVALGVSALQLAHDGPGLTLSALIDTGRLTAPPSTLPRVPGTAPAAAALGYLHANCGNCHNAFSDVQDKAELRLWLTVAELATVEATPTYQTTVGKPQLRDVDGAEALVDPGSPETSAVFLRMNSLDAIGMPKEGRELLDLDGLTAIAAWIRALAPPP